MKKLNTFLIRYAFKDLFRQKTRTFLGVFGIGISIFLLTTVSFGTDTISYSFVDFITLDAGNHDLVLEARSHYGQPENWTDYFDYEDIIQEITQNTSEIEYFLARSEFDSWVNFDDPELSSSYAEMTALDVAFEESIQFGEYENIKSGVNLAEGLPTNHCIVSVEFADKYNLQAGDQINVWVHQVQASVNLTISSEFTTELKFRLWDEPTIIVDLSWWGQTADKMAETTEAGYPVDTWVGKTDHLVLILKDASTLYDTRDVEGSEAKISQIGEDIILTLGLNEWKLDYPKLELLFLSEFLSMFMSIIFIMIGLLTMLLSGILINGLLSTSVEERIREYGINRVLGARKNYNLKLILIQATLICLAGTTLGVILSYFSLKYILMGIVENMLAKRGFRIAFTFIASPRSVILSYIIGVGVSLIVSIAPVLKVMNSSIVSSINPYRTTDEVYHMEKEGGPNKKLIILGAIFAGNTGFVFFLIPRVLLSLKIAVLAGILIGTLLLFMIGVSLMAVGLMPLILRMLIKIFTPRNQTLMNIVKTTIHRHRRRNLSTTVMLILSFSFIMFTTSMGEIQSAQVASLIQYEMGSDLLITPRYYNLQTPTVSFRDEIMQYDGIERASMLLANADELERIYSEEGKTFGVQMGDLINYNYARIRLYGIDTNFVNTISDEMQQYIRFTEGDKEYAFDAVFDEDEINVIISTHVASDLSVHLGEKVRLTFYRGTDEEIFVANIVGVAKNMPGMPQFKEGGLLAGGQLEDGGAGSALGFGDQSDSARSANGGVIISAYHYVKCMNIPEDAYIDKIFIKTRPEYDPIEVGQELRDTIGDRGLRVRIAQIYVDDAETAWVGVKWAFTGILIGTVIIALFGLISSSYSSILERKREIGVLRTLGLYGTGKVSVEQMFWLENVILLLSSSTAGGLIGFAMAFGLSENMTMFMNSPRIIEIPWDTVAVIYGFSIIFLRVGMRWLFRKVRKQNLIEIFRETL